MKNKKKLYKLQKAIEINCSYGFFYDFKDFIISNRERGLLEDEKIKGVVKTYEPGQFILQSPRNSCCVLSSIEDVFRHIVNNSEDIALIFSDFFDNL